MLTSQELKQQLTAIAENEYPFPAEEEAEALLQAMVAHTGDPDFELRDTLVYTTFARWISTGRLGETRLHCLCSTMLDDRRLFYKIDEINTDAAVTRTFSMLVLALIVYTHRQRPFLTLEEIHRIQNRVLDYAGREKDRRGYDDKIGWVHAAAHAADTLDELAQCQELGKEDLLALLGGIRSLAAVPEAGYAHDEDERLSVAAASVFERQVLSREDWSVWLDGLVQAAAETPGFVPGYTCQINVKHFLRSLFFRMRRLSEAGKVDQGIAADFINRLDAAVKKATRF